MAKLFETIARLSATIESGVLLNSSSMILKISVDEPSQGKCRGYFKSINCNFALTSCKESSFSHSRLLRLALQEGDKEEDISWELWSRNRIVQVKDLKKSHSVLTSSPAFGKISWSTDDKFVAYTAEDTPKKSSNFWSGEENSGNQFWYKETFGEGLNHLTEPKLFVYKIPENEVSEIKTPENIYPTHPVFRPGTHDLYFIGLEKSSYKLGLAGMLNRKSKLFKLSELGENLEEIEFPSEYMAGLYPKFSPNGQFLSFLGVPKGSLSHIMCLSMLIQDLNSGEIRVLVPEITDFNPNFNGIYGFQDTISSYGWIDNESLFLETPHNASDCIFKVSINGDIQELNLPINKPYSAEILDVIEGSLLVKVSNFITPEQVFLFNSNDAMNPKLIENTSHDDLNTDERELKEKLREINTTVINNQNNPSKSILYHSSSNKNLIVIIHGGPHSVGRVDYSIKGAYMLFNNMNILVVNYSGSLGFGSKSLNSLLGQIGNIDVEDCIQSIEKAKTLCQAEKVFTYGLSHGGFLSAHLASRMQLSGSVVINGVIDVASMLLTTDITDWGFAEACRSEIILPPTEEQYIRMYRASPIARANKIMCPVLICAGSSDITVPSVFSQALYRVLKANNKECKMLWYPDQNHLILGIPEGYDLIVSSMNWILEQISKN